MKSGRSAAKIAAELGIRPPLLIVARRFGIRYSIDSRTRREADGEKKARKGSE
jgi:hypothetical protein